MPRTGLTFPWGDSSRAASTQGPAPGLRLPLECCLYEDPAQHSRHREHRRVADVGQPWHATVRIEARWRRGDAGSVRITLRSGTCPEASLTARLDHNRVRREPGAGGERRLARR